MKTEVGWLVGWFSKLVLNIIAVEVILTLNCYLDINECAKSPCKNGATCQNTAGSYQCACQRGYADRNCETGKLPCKIKNYRLVP